MGKKKVENENASASMFFLTQVSRFLGCGLRVALGNGRRIGWVESCVYN